MCEGSECHHRSPERTDTDRTWKILKPEKDSCLLSCRPLLSSTLNCTHQLVFHWLSEPIPSRNNYHLAIVLYTTPFLAAIN